MSDPYRDDRNAMLARLDQVQHENSQLTDENLHLRHQNARLHEENTKMGGRLLELGDHPKMVFAGEHLADIIEQLNRDRAGLVAMRNKLRYGAIVIVAIVAGLQVLKFFLGTY